MKVYAGVGSRSASLEISTIMYHAARCLRHMGWTLRSGHASGSDQSFERGAGSDAEIYLPWPGFEKLRPISAKTVQQRPIGDAYDIASQVHPAWASLTQGVKALHARNAHQVLGPDLRTPVAFVLCWTPDAKVVGGTATAIRIANSWGIEVRNLGDPQVLWRVQRMIETVSADLPG